MSAIPTTELELTDPPAGAPAETPRAPARRPRLVPARRAASSGLHGAAMFALVALTMAAVGLLYLVQTSQVAGLGYEVSTLQRRLDEEAIRNEQLSYQVARYQSLPLVERVAVDQLHMQPMDDYIWLNVARPASDDLALPDANPTLVPTLASRIWDRLTGRGSAAHDAAESTQ